MTNIQIFSNPKFGVVRLDIRSDGERWYVLNDACRVLGLSNASDTASRLDDDEKDGVGITDPIGRIQETTIVSEAGLYSLILTSRKPEAKAFKRWITHEVIPSTRKTGFCGTSEFHRLQYEVNLLTVENENLVGENTLLKRKLRMFRGGVGSFSIHEAAIHLMQNQLGDGNV